jgi:iron complex outermembrane receptor protein
MLMSGAAIGALSIATPAAAQSSSAAPPPTEAQNDSGTAIQDIIVTATRRAESLQDVPMSVDVATGDKLQKLNVFDVKDVSTLAPGLELTNTSGRNNTTTLRGITFDPDQGTAPAVQVYYNDIPTDAQTAYTAIYDVQQIEVLRGPQGLLRGLSAPAGAITIATRRPGFDHIEGYGQLTGTTRDAYNVQGGVSLPFSDKLSLRVAGLVDGNRLNNVRDVNLGGERSRSRTESIRATLGWRPNANFTAYLTYQYLTADNRQFQQVIGSGNTPYGQYTTLFGIPTVFLPPAFGGGPFPADTTVRSGPALGTSDYGAVADGIFRSQNNTHLVNLAADYDLGGSTLSFVGAHQFTKLTITRDLDVGNTLPGYVQSSDVVTPYKVDTGELRWTSNNDKGFGWGLGAFYQRQTGTTLVTQDATQFWYAVAPSAQVNLPCAAIGLGAPFCNGFTPFPLPNSLGISTLVRVPVNTQTASFNGTLRYVAGPLRIEGGVRYSIIRSVQTTQLTLSGAQNSGPTEVIPANLQKFIYRPFTGGLTISYAITPALNIYAAYGHSFRGGSTKVAGPAFVSDDLIRTQPEKTDSIEVGLKGGINQRLGFTLAGYYQKINNYLSRFTGIYYNSPADVSPTGFFDFNYNANATIKGVEGSIDGRITPNWDVSLNAAYTQARFDNARVPCNDFAGTGTPNQTGTPKVTGPGNVSYCKTNGRLAEVPDFSLTANTEIRFPIGRVTPYVRGLVVYRPGFYSERVQYQYRDRELVNLFIGVRGENARWDLSVFARNLLNQQRITNISLGTATNGTLLGTGVFDSGYRQVNVTNPREFGATLAFKW